jgi:hypothetical protein
MVLAIFQMVIGLWDYRLDASSGSSMSDSFANLSAVSRRVIMTN